MYILSVGRVYFQHASKVIVCTHRPTAQLSPCIRSVEVYVASAYENQTSVSQVDLAACCLINLPLQAAEIGLLLSSSPISFL